MSVPKTCNMKFYNMFIKRTDDMCCQVPSMQNSSYIRPHVVRKIAAAVAEHQMGGSRPSSKDWVKASVRHTTTCTRSQVCLSDGEYIYIYIHSGMDGIDATLPKHIRVFVDVASEISNTRYQTHSPF